MAPASIRSLRCTRARIRWRSGNRASGTNDYHGNVFPAVRGQADLSAEPVRRHLQGQDVLLRLLRCELERLEAVPLPYGRGSASEVEFARVESKTRPSLGL